MHKGFPSRYDGRFPCKHCGQKWNKGELISCHNNVWYHHKCYVDILNGVEPAQMVSNPFNKPEPKPVKKFDLTDQQKVIVEASKESGNMIVNAGAGCAKTSTMMEVMGENKGKSILYLCFGKDPQTEAQEELVARGFSHVTASTFHSWGFKALRSSGRKVKVETGKVRKLCKAILPDNNKDDKRRLNAYPRLITLYQNTLLTPKEIIVNYDLDLEESDLKYFNQVVDACHDTWVRYGEINLDEMLYQPFKDQSSLGYYDIIVIDEAQDGNSIQLELLKQVARRATKFIFVGDKQQAIYGFRGANKDSMDRIEQAFSCKKFSLSQTFRCPPAIVDRCKDLNLCGDFEAFFPDNPGEINFLSDWNKYLKTLVSLKDEGALCVSPLNAPIIKMFYRLINEGVRAKILGKNIVDNLYKILDRLSTDNIETSIREFQVYREYKYKQYRKRYGDDQDRIDNGMSIVDDSIECLTEIALRCDYVREIPRELNKLFKHEEGAQVTLSTVHKSKGMENKNVMILANDKFKLFYNDQGKEMEYVANTRSSHRLFICEDK